MKLDAKAKEALEETLLTEAEKEMLTPNEIFDIVLDYEGIIGYGDTIRNMVKSIYGVDLTAISRNISIAQARANNPELYAAIKNARAASRVLQRIAKPSIFQNVIVENMGRARSVYDQYISGVKAAIRQIGDYSHTTVDPTSKAYLDSAAKLDEKIEAIRPQFETQTPYTEKTYWEKTQKYYDAAVKYTLAAIYEVKGGEEPAKITKRHDEPER